VACAWNLQKFYLIKYQPGEKYDPHLDPHDESEYGPQQTKRIATVVVYLSDVGSGGETLFPREGKDGKAMPA
jgi:prolyl 4-hydroxylase